MSIFDDIAAALAALIGATAEEAGWILGGTLTLALLLVFFILASIIKSDNAGPFISFAAMTGIILSVLFGWWEPWTIILAGLLLAVLVVGPLASKG